MKAFLITAALLVFTMALAGCDDGGKNKGTYRTHEDNEREQDSEWQDNYCRQHPRDCR
jgi:hypothetical protein